MVVNCDGQITPMMILALQSIEDNEGWGLFHSEVLNKILEGGSAARSAILTEVAVNSTLSIQSHRMESPVEQNIISCAPSPFGWRMPDPLAVALTVTTH